MKINLFLPLLLVLSSISSTSCNKSLNFATDSWSHLIEVMNKGGYQALLDTYKPNDNSFVITKNDVTAEQIAKKTRTITLKDYGNFNVRVIGENIDKIDDENNACLTFEFNEIVTTCAYHDQRESYKSNWETSTLRKTLNNDILNSFPSEIKDNIQTVKKPTFSIEKRGFVFSDEKIFALSPFEITSNNLLKPNNLDVEDPIYPYYLWHKKEKDFIKNLFNKETKQSTPIPYWFRSPDDIYVNNVFGVSERGDYNRTSYLISACQGVSPVFCLGKIKKEVSFILDASGFECVDFRMENDTYKGRIIASKYKRKNGEEVSVHSVPAADSIKSILDGMNSSVGFDYNPENGEFSAASRYIKNQFIIRISSADILLNFDDLNEIATYDESNHLCGGYAKTLFNIGDTKTVNLGSIGEKKMRILDFGHDLFDDNGKQNVSAMTFDFIESIKPGTFWYKKETDARDFLSSNLMDVLTNEENQDSVVSVIKNNQNDFYKILRNGLHYVHRAVDGINWVLTPYVCKVTTPSVSQVDIGRKPKSDDEGTLYSYCFENTISCIKGAYPYWLRSPSTYHYDSAYAVTSVEGDEFDKIETLLTNVNKYDGVLSIGIDPLFVI